MKIFLSGPMRNYIEHNFPAFDALAAKLRADGHEVLNPAEAFRTSGFDGSTIAPTDTAFLAKATLDRLAELATCQKVFFLYRWEDSQGARLEHDFAQLIGIEIEYEQVTSSQRRIENNG